MTICAEEITIEIIYIIYFSPVSGGYNDHQKLRLRCANTGESRGYNAKRKWPPPLLSFVRSNK